MDFGLTLGRFLHWIRSAKRGAVHGLLVFLDLIGLYSYRQVDQQAQLTRFRMNHVEFRALLTANNDFLTIVAELEESRLSDYLPHPAWVKKQVLRAAVDVHRMVKCLNAISDNRYPLLVERYQSIADKLAKQLEGISGAAPSSWVLDLSEIRAEDAWQVGGKMASLGEIRNGIGLPTPPGFAVTAEAYQSMIRAHGFLPGAGGEESDEERADPSSRPPVPETIREAILDAYDRLSQTIGAPPAVAVRSSAIGEDSAASFAGQYLTMLNVRRDGLVEAYRRVVESLFSAEAVHYRRLHKLGASSMPVGFLVMADAVASGVVYTADPMRPDEGVILVHVVKGLGPSLVDGRTSPETIRVERDPELRIGARTSSLQKTMVVSRPEGGIWDEPLSTALAAEPALRDDEVLRLAQMAASIDAHFGGPQDIEWAMDAGRRIWLLQSRPLRMARPSGEEPSPPVEGSPLLLEGGEASYPGVGAGPVMQMDEDEDMTLFPDGAVLVAPRSSPRFVRLMGKAAAIVTDFGAVTGHMAALTREFRVPALLNTRTATERLKTGVHVTVDARTGRVYQGEVRELLEAESNRALEEKRDRGDKTPPAFRLLDAVSERVIALNLVDPRSPDFSPEHCLTLHDIARFVHEKSYGEMFQMGEHLGDLRGVSTHLDVFLPIDLYMIDLGGGLDAPPGARRLKPSHVASIPLKALLAGMLDKRIPRFGPRPMDLRGFMSIMMRHAATSPEQERTFRDPCYALISDKYLNYTARVGYHFGVVDAYCGESVNKNYISLLFRGGAADYVRRHRRVRAIAGILDHYGFSTSVRGDAITARLSKRGQSETQGQLEMVGRLLQYFRQMDAAMRSEEIVSHFQEAFIQGDFSLAGERRGSGEQGE
ncbi:MAG: PEP/pyruvate-binding domain-containing protein [Thermodesulfobacteriota bacterium]